MQINNIGDTREQFHHSSCVLISIRLKVRPSSMEASMLGTSGRLLGAFSRWEAFCLHPGFVLEEISPLGEIFYLTGQTRAVEGCVNHSEHSPSEGFFSSSLKEVLTHWAGQLPSNSLWNFWQDEALSLLSSRHFHSWSLAFQHAFLSAEFGAAITFQRKHWLRTDTVPANLTGTWLHLICPSTNTAGFFLNFSHGTWTVQHYMV